MDFKQLQTFLAIAECGSATKAAHMLHIVQPALSKQIAALERDGMRGARADAWITAHIEETVPGPHAPVIARMMEGL